MSQHQQSQLLQQQRPCHQTHLHHISNHHHHNSIHLSHHQPAPITLTQRHHPQPPPPPPLRTNTTNQNNNNNNNTSIGNGAVVNPVQLLTNNQNSNISNNNQVPLLNFNTFAAAAQPFLNIPAPAALVAAQLNLTGNNQTNQQQQPLPRHCHQTLNYHHPYAQQQAAPITRTQQPSTTPANVTNNTNSNGGSTNANAAPAPNTNQVPLLNFNSYTAAQPFLNLPAPALVAAHLNICNTNLNQTTITNHQQQQRQPIPNINGNNSSNVLATSAAANAGNNRVQPPPPACHQRPLATNTTLNNVANQQQNNFRSTAPPSALQQPATNTNSAAPLPPPTSAPQRQTTIGGGLPIANIFSDETLNSLYNEHLQAILLNQLFANRFVPPVAPPPAATLNPSNGEQQQHQQVPPVIPAQPSAAAQVAVQRPQTQSQEPASEPAPQYQPQQATNNVQNRVVAHDNYSSTNTNGLYQQQQTQPGPLNQLQPPQLQEHPTTQQQQPLSPSQQQQQHQQQQTTQQQAPQPQSIPPPPPVPFYALPQMEQALAFLANPQVANSLFSQVFNIYLQGGLRTGSHPHHPPHFHHYMHDAHHHHHHHHHHGGPNGQQNGQDVTMPLDSLAISESKPRGLNRAEIDSLTPYIQMNEKDSRTCVICLSRFEVKARIRPLPCNHAFHAKCVDKWLKTNRTCPICRRDALKTMAKIKRY